MFVKLFVFSLGTVIFTVNTLGFLDYELASPVTSLWVNLRLN